MLLLFFLSCCVLKVVSFWFYFKTLCLFCVSQHVQEVVPKSKGVPQQAELAQGVPGRLRLRIFLTFRHYKGGRSSATRTDRLYRRRNPWYSLSEAESNSGHMVLSGVPRKKSPVTSPGIDPGTVRLVARKLSLLGANADQQWPQDTRGDTR